MLIDPLLSLSIALNNWSSGDCADVLLLSDVPETLDVPEVAEELAVPASEPEICCNPISSDMISWLNEPPAEADDDWSSLPGGGGGALACVVKAEADDESVDVDDEAVEDELAELDCSILSNEKMSVDELTLPTAITLS